VTELPPLGLYVHLPWCERKCPYCDFNSHEADALPEAQYVAALLRDLESDISHLHGRSIDTLFIGGGTPSLFSVDAIARLLHGIAQIAPLAPALEATLEANPGSAEAEKFAGFRAAGITRLSLGVQSFDDRQLVALGRVHDGAQAQSAIRFAQDAGFDSINLDLMHGLPGQTAVDALADLRTALEYGTAHLSWYQLAIEPNTVFHKRPPALPNDDELSAIQAACEPLLRAAGISQYEVSAYARDGFRCRHNDNYWTFGDYLAIGAGAHGKITGPDGVVRRYAKRRQPQEYLAATAGTCTVSQQVLAENDLVGEFMMNALRRNEGFSLRLFQARTGLDSRVVTARLQSLCERELLLQEGDRFAATSLGRRFLDSVVGEFF